MKRPTIRPEDSLPLAGMHTADTDRAKARGEAEGAELSAEIRRPLRDISDAAGKMERSSPLFFGTGDNPTLF